MLPYTVYPTNTLKNDKVVVMVSMDGMRYDYMYRNLTPNLNEIANTGIMADSLIPVFPSVTFPNHYTIVTGLYPESHGIVGNMFYDPVRNMNFSYTNSGDNGDGYWWQRGEPVWVTAAKHGYKTATCMWPGSEAEIQGIRPTYWLKYNSSMTLDDKLRTVMHWLDLPSHSRPSLIHLYIPTIDGMGHQYGPDSQQVNTAIHDVDAGLGSLYTKIRDMRTRNMLVDLIVVGDHGMAQTDSKDKVVFLDDVVNVGDVWCIVNGPVVSVYPINSNTTTTIMQKLVTASKLHGHFMVFGHDTVPLSFHYSQSDRIAPVTIVADMGWSIVISRSGYDPSNPPFPTGMHGYNNTDPLMHSIFIANGPSFKSVRDVNGKGEKLRVPSLMNIEIYQMVCWILGVPPAPNNGTSGWMDTVTRDWLVKS